METECELEHFYLVAVGSSRDLIGLQSVERSDSAAGYNSPHCRRVVVSRILSRGVIVLAVMPFCMVFSRAGSGSAFLELSRPATAPLNYEYMNADDEVGTYK